MAGEEKKRVRLASMKRKSYETGIVVMQSIAQALVRAMLEREKCRIVVEYDPAQDRLKMFKELWESPNNDSYIKLVRDGKDLIQILNSVPEDKRPMLSAIAGAFIDGMIAREQLTAERPSM